MTLEELRDQVLFILSSASIETDNHGQVLVYTGLTADDDGTLRWIDADYEGE